MAMRLGAQLTVVTSLLLAASITLATGNGKSRNSGVAARVEFARGMSALRDGRIALARRAFSEAVALAPEWGLAYLQWGIVELSVDAEGTIARGCLEAAAELAPDNPRAHFHLGVLYDKSGRLEDAIREYRAALQLRPRMRKARFKLAAALALAGDREDAIATYEELLARQPTHTGTLAALADLYEQTKRLADAERALVAIVRSQPDVAYNHYRLGQFYERIGEQRKAHRAFSRADSLDPRPQRKMRKLR